jgi:hypothetical protein
MTLGEYVDLVCQKCRRTDNPTRDEARTYIRNKYRTIYESKPWRDVSGVVAVPIAAEQVTILPEIVDRVISCRWSSSITLPNASLYEIMEINPHRFDEVGDPISYSIISPSAVAIPPLGQKVRATTSSSTPEFKLSMHGSYQGEKVYEVINMTGNATVESMYRYDEIYSLSIGDRTSDVEIKRADDGVKMLFLNTWENEKKHQRLHFHSTPQNATTALILHKRDFHPLLDDSSAPEISGMETCLEEFAMYDMRQAERQYGMAGQHLQAASAAVAAMADLERHQSAYKIKIIPWYGFGGPAVSLPGKGYWW